MSDWADDLLSGGGGADWADELLSGGDMPQVGVTLEGLDTERAAADQARFKPWSGPDQIPLQQQSSAGAPQWTGDALDSLADFGQRGAMSATMGYGDEILGALGADKGAIRDRQQLAQERSPGWSMAGDIAGGVAMALPTAAATGGLPLAGRVAAGMGLGAEQAALSASGYADDGDRWGAAKDAAPIGAALGGAGELAGAAVSGLGNVARENVAPWLREQGLLNRTASTGRPVAQLSNELGGRQGMIDAGQWMENNDLTSWSPQKLQRGIGDIVDARTGDQGQFLDDLAANPDAYPVDVNPVTQDLMGRGYEQSGLVAKGAQQQGGQYMGLAGELADKAPGGQMDFRTAWRNRQGFDQDAKWNLGDGGDKGFAEVSRDAANGMRGAMGESLDNTAPQLRDQWEGIQGDISTGLALSGGGDAATVRQLGGAPAPLKFSPMAAAAGTGPMGYGAALLAQTGGRGMMADALGGASGALDSLATNVPGSAGMRGAGQLGAQYEGRVEGAEEKTRGYLISDAAFQMMQQPGSLGPYESKFWEAYKSPDGGALSQLIVRLSHTDNAFKPYFKQMQQLTAGEY